MNRIRILILAPLVLFQSVQPLKATPLAHHTQYEYLYDHLLKPLTPWEQVVSTIQYQAKCLTTAGLLAATTAWITVACLTDHSAAQQQKHFETKKDRFVQNLNRLKNRYQNLKKQSTTDKNKLQQTENPESPSWVSTPTIIFTLALTAGYYLALKRFIINHPTPYSNRFSNFLADWPLHASHVSPHLQNYFSELHALHTQYQDEWTLREDVAQKCLEMLAQVA